MRTKLKWYLNRLSLMSLDEVVYRTGQAVKNRIPSLRELKVPERVNETASPWFSSQEAEETRKTYLKKFKKLPDPEINRLLAIHIPTEMNQVDWHTDYSSGKKAPRIPAKQIDYRDEGQVGDIKYIWELNRHHHLVILAKKAFLTKDEEGKKEVLEQISSWIAENPYGIGVNWESGLEVGIRLIQWSWIWTFLDGCLEAEKERWLQSIYEHCYFLEHHFSRYSSVNNHLIGEAAGLFVASLMWPCWEESKRWGEKAYKILLNEIKNQNHADGINKEQALSYQQFVIDFFLLAGIFGKQNEVHFSAEYWSKLELMCDAIASLMNVKKEMPQIGDADDGFAIKYTNARSFNNYTSIITTAVLLFDRKDLKSLSGEPDEKTFWLLGMSSVDQYKKMKEVSYKIKTRFGDAGYFVLGSGFGCEKKEVKLVFDCGSLGLEPLAAHGHADALSFTLSINGVPFFIDPGTYAYHTKRKWRNYFRGTSAHNTIRIDEVDQSVIGGNFMWIKKAKTQLVAHTTDDAQDFVSAQHTGYARLKDPVTHQRDIRYLKKEQEFLVFDHVFCSSKHRFEQHFHLDSYCKIEKSDHNSYVIQNGLQKVRIELDESLECELFQGSEDPVLGWQSLSYGVKVPAFTIRGCCHAVGSQVFQTKITLL